MRYILWLYQTKTMNRRLSPTAIPSLYICFYKISELHIKKP